MTNHTPGPWKITTAYGIAVLADGQSLCEMWRRGNDTQAMVDARLIAAAPDLLKTLNEIADWCDRWTTPGHPVSAIAHAAIKKAMGEE